MNKPKETNIKRESPDVTKRGQSRPVYDETRSERNTKNINTKEAQHDVVGKTNTSLITNVDI